MDICLRRENRVELSEKADASVFARPRSCGRERVRAAFACGNDNLLIIQQVRERTRDSARSRKAILDAAEKLFAERGYETATMERIAAGAGLSRAAPAYFYGSKAVLYREVLGRAFEETGVLIRSIDSGDLESVIAAGIARYLDFLAERPHFVQLVVRECLDGGRFLQQLPQHLAALGAGMQVVGRRGGGLRRDVDPRHLLLSTISLCWFPILARPLTTDLGFEPDSRDFAQERKVQVTTLLVNGALAKG